MSAHVLDARWVVPLILITYHVMINPWLSYQMMVINWINQLINFHCLSHLSANKKRYLYLPCYLNIAGWRQISSPQFSAVPCQVGRWRYYQPYQECTVTVFLAGNIAFWGQKWLKLRQQHGRFFPCLWRGPTMMLKQNNAWSKAITA